MPKRATEHRVAVVQHAPVTLHRKETLERGVDLIEEAAAKGARLISFPETWVPGYPEWLWRLRPVGDYELTGEIHRRQLVPTNPERMVWGMGDATGLRVTETPVGRVGGLICWENYMPLVRFTL